MDFSCFEIFNILGRNSFSLSFKMDARTIKANEFFKDNVAPESLASDSVRLNSFISRATKDGRKVVCITSGGTTVPLEKNTVRFLDNFSTGSRGSKCAEQFLQAGYYVIFLTRTKSAAPYARVFQEHLSPSFDLSFMSFLSKPKDGNSSLGK